MRSIMKHYAPKFELLRRIIGKENPVIVEIGSHFGEDSLRFLESFPGVELHCFEPDPRSIKVFKKYVKDSRVRLYEVALSDTEGVATFYQSYQPADPGAPPAKYDWIDESLYHEEELSNSGSSSLKKGYQFNKSTTIEVTTQRFDSWLNEPGSPEEIDFAWIDVQGAEKNVLEGMGAHIRKIKLIWIEYGETTYEGSLTRAATVDYMNERGYSVVEQFSSQTAAGDLLFLRRENV